MKQLDQNSKQNIVGGMAPGIIWGIVTCATVLISLISGAVTASLNISNSKKQAKKTNNFIPQDSNSVISTKAFKTK